MRKNSVPIYLSREQYPHSYEFHGVTIKLKSGRMVKCDDAFWQPKSKNGNYLVIRNRIADPSQTRDHTKSEVLPIDGTIVFVEDADKRFIFETCEENNLDHVCGEDIAFFLSPICHATLYSRKDYRLIAKDVCVGGRSSGGVPYLAYFTSNRVHSNQEWISSATQIPVDTLVFAPKKEIHWETSLLVWP